MPFILINILLLLMKVSMTEYQNHVSKVLIIDDNKETLYLTNEMLGEEIGTLHLGR